MLTIANQLNHRVVMRILAIGDNCIDAYSYLGRRFPGGNALNVAVFANRHENIQADYVGIIGYDDNGDYLLSQVKSEGLDTGYIIRKEGITAVTKIILKEGERVFDEYIEGVQTDAVLHFDKIPNPKDYDLIHFTIWGFGREHSKTLKETSNVLLSCDFSSQLDDPRTEIMPYLDVSFFSGSHLIDNEEDPKLILKKLKENTLGLVVMTLGKYGSIAYDGELFYQSEAIPVNVVDTLGAGDAFIAEFLCHRILGKTISESLEAGHNAATKICKRHGAWGGDY
jgi:fructoselysine 6-kinase